jgi:hypothetical protein
MANLSGIFMERFLIVQLDMLTQNWNDEQDDQTLLETAVLYYYQHPTNHQHHHNSPPLSTIRDTTHVIDDSLRLFLGLCTTLYTLPNELHKTFSSPQQQQQQCREMVVQLASSTRLLFLEIETNILAVAQVSYHSQHSTTTTASPSSATSLRISNIAIQDSMKNAHRYFCLLRGGSIRRRLSMGFDTSRIHYGNSHKDNDDDHHHGNKRRLVVEQLQNELRIHYDSYMATESMCSWVIPIPAPVPLLSHLHEWYVAPVTGISTITQTHIPSTLEEILQIRYPKWEDDHNRMLRDDGLGCRVLGIATFAQGQLQHVTTSSNENERNHFDISNDTAVLLMRYMSQFQYQLSTFHTEEEEIGRGLQSFTPSPHRRSPFAFLDDSTTTTMVSSSFVAPSPSATSSTCTTAASHGSNTRIRNLSSTNGFLTSPPLSLLSALDESKNHEFVIYDDIDKEDGGGCGSSSKKVWAPPVFLSRRKGRKHDPGTAAHALDQAAAATIADEDYWIARVALYCCGDFSFLLFVSCQTDSLAVHDHVQHLLYSALFRDIHTLFLKLMCHVDRLSPDHKEMIRDRAWSKPGQTIISMNRTNQNLIIFPDPVKSVDEVLKLPSSTKTAMKRDPADFVGLFSPKKQQKAKEQQLFHNSCAYRSFAVTNLDTDCRHLLLSQLSPDCLWALQDAMEEVRHIHCPLEYDDDIQDETNDSSPFELCSLLRNDWIYCWANHHVELYVILDAAYYVTVADVHKAVLDIRNELLVGEKSPML